MAMLFTLGFAPLEAFQSLSDFSRSVRTLTQKVSPAVVQVVVSGYGASSEGEGQEVSLLSRQRSSASGVIVDSGGYIITNAHVIRGAVNVRVLMPVERRNAVDDRVRLLCSGSVVEPHQRPSVHLFLQDGKIAADELRIERARG